MSGAPRSRCGQLPSMVRPDFSRGRGGSMTPRGRGGRGGFRGGAPGSAPGKFGGGDGSFRGRGGGGDRSPYRGGRGGFSPRGGDRGRGGFDRGRGGFDRGRGGFDRGRGGRGRSNSGRGGSRGGGQSVAPRRKFEEEEKDDDDMSDESEEEKGKATVEDQSDDDMVSDEEEEDDSEDDDDEEDSEPEEPQRKAVPTKSATLNGSGKQPPKKTVIDKAIDNNAKGKVALPGKDVSLVVQAGSDDDEDDSEEDEDDSEEEEDDEEPPKVAQKAKKIPTDPKSKVLFTPESRAHQSLSEKKVTSATKLQVTPHPGKSLSIGRKNGEAEEPSDEDDEEESHGDPTGKGKALAATSSKATASIPQSSKTEEKASAKRKLETGSETPGGKLRKVALTTPDEKLLSEETERLRDRDRRTLFFKDLPKGCTDQDIKSLSDDILAVRRKGKESKFGWLLFADEETCERNFHKLKKGLMKGKFKLTLDYCGEKSEHQKKKVPTAGEKVESINALELYIGNVPKSVTMEDLKKQFPTAIDVHFPKKRGHQVPETKYAFVSFVSAQEARKAFEKNRKLELGGVPLEVMYAKVKAKPVQATAAESSGAAAQIAHKKSNLPGKRDIEPSVEQKSAAKLGVKTTKKSDVKRTVAEAESDEDDGDDDDESLEEDEESEEEEEEDDDEEDE